MKAGCLIPSLLLFSVLTSGSFAADQTSPAAPSITPPNRIASFFISETLINQLLKENLKSPLLRDVVIALDPENHQIIARGLLKVPTEEMKAINIEKGLGDFHFQVAIQLKTTRRGHLILIFPLNQTYFYPADSTDPVKDRIIIPVQLLSLAMGSARGYLAVLSGDFSGFDHKEAALRQQMADLDRQIASSKDPDERDALANDRKGLEIQLAAIPIERKQGEKTAKKMSKVLGFVGEKEINLNEELSVHRNALVMRIQMGQLAPYLDGIELGGVRLIKDERDGSGENFLAVDLNASLAAPYTVPERTHVSGARVKTNPPDVVIRLNQSLLESKAVMDAETQDMGKHIGNFSMDMQEDGIHVAGYWHEMLLPRIPFDAIVDFVWTANNVFEIRVRDVRFAHINLTSLTGLVLEAAKNRLDRTLKGMCTFQYVGEEKDRSRAVRVTVNMATFLPAFPNMNLTGIAVREKELLLKAGKN